MSATSISALAADPILLEPSSSPPNASFQVTILSVGLVRTMLHPRVSESFRRQGRAAVQAAAVRR